MEQRLTKIEIKLDKVEDHLIGIRETVDKNSVSLDYHIKRTDLNEVRIAKVERGILAAVAALALALISRFI